MLSASVDNTHNVSVFSVFSTHLRALVHRMTLFWYHRRHTRHGPSRRLGWVPDLTLIDRCILSTNELVALSWWRLLHPGRLLRSPILCVLVTRVKAIRVITSMPDILSPLAQV